MNKKLLTSCVFLDTNIFVGQNFDFENQILKTFSNLAFEGKIEFYLTEITQREIVKQIKDSVDSSRESFNLFKKNARIFQNSRVLPLQALYKKIDYESCILDFNQQFNDFQKLAKVKIIDCFSVNANKIFNDYFSVNAPFGMQGKEKEFPDAFVIEALRNWTKIDGTKLYVVSKDSDFRKAIEKDPNLILLDDIDEFISLYNEFDNKLYAKIENIIKDNSALINERFTEELNKIGFYLEDEDGWVEDFYISSSLIEKITLLNTSPTEARVQLIINCNLTLSIEVNDYENSPYDSEEGKYIFVKKLKGEIEQECELIVDLDVIIDAYKDMFYSVKNIVINNGSSIPIIVDKDNQYDLISEEDEYLSSL